MRPIDKGPSPGDYTQYRDAGPELQTRIGDHCSYCERQIETHLAVEHVQPKSDIPALRNSWSNFLLACVNCNSCKGDTQLNVADYLWPDLDNTLLAMEYVEGGLIQPRSTVSPTIRDKALATIELSGLDKYPGNADQTRKPTSTDRRWLRRLQTWELAQKARTDLGVKDDDLIRAWIVRTAASRGNFSIWWTVFDGDPDMRRRLREAFIGTSSTCFDAEENLLHRFGGQA